MAEDIEYTEDMHAENVLRILDTNNPCIYCPVGLSYTNIKLCKICNDFINMGIL